MTIIDRQMPTWQRRVLQARAVRAPSSETHAAIRRVDFFGSPLVAIPNRARVWFDRVFRGESTPATRGRFGFEDLLADEGGFHLLDEDGSEVVLGFIGRWWDRGYGRLDWVPEELADFDRPGYGLGVWGFTVLGRGDAESVLVTDVRVRCTDEEARRKFERYWRLVGPFVTAMGGSVLRLVQQEAEHPETGKAISDGQPRRSVQ